MAGHQDTALRDSPDRALILVAVSYGDRHSTNGEAHGGTESPLVNNDRLYRWVVAVSRTDVTKNATRITTASTTTSTFGYPAQLCIQ